MEKNVKIKSFFVSFFIDGKKEKFFVCEYKITLGNAENLLYFYHPDHLGSTSYITDKNGEVSQHEEYIPFGESLVSEHRNDKLNAPWKFNGKELDADTGFYYYGARFYSPRESLWLSTDPLSGYNPVFEEEHYIDGQHNGGVYNSFNHNTYGYCYQNPVRLIDPNGKQALPQSSVEPAKRVVMEVIKGGVLKVELQTLHG